MNAFIKTRFLFAHMKFDNLAKTENLFPAFLRKQAIYSSKLKVLSISTPNSYSFLLSQMFAFPICAQTFSYINPEASKWHLNWLNFLDQEKNLLALLESTLTINQIVCLFLSFTIYYSSNQGKVLVFVCCNRMHKVRQ